MLGGHYVLTTNHVEEVNEQRKEERVTACEITKSPQQADVLAEKAV